MQGDAPIGRAPVAGVNQERHKHMADKVLVIGKSGRFHCIADALHRSPLSPEIYWISEKQNPALKKISPRFRIGRTDDRELVRNYASQIRPDLAVIGPEEPLKEGVADDLRAMGIPCVGPGKDLARIETSKSLARDVLANSGLDVNPRYEVFTSTSGIRAFVKEIGKFVVKPDGLTGGKGVKVYGDHFTTIDEGFEYCAQLIRETGAAIIEEKLEGEEFSLQSLCDGRHIIDTVVVQDHKRAYADDRGPNTGGMGSYTGVGGTLPFLTTEDIRAASDANLKVMEQLGELDQSGLGYRGVLYGGFIATADGVRVIEYNARFGDPEVMNVLPLMKADFLEVCWGMALGTLASVNVSFDNRATVCKYVVPEGYPDGATPRQRLSGVPDSGPDLRVFYGAVDQTDDGNFIEGSRSVAMVGIGDTIEAAEKIAEAAASRVQGQVRHRADIGTAKSIRARIEHMEMLRSEPLRIAL